MRTKQMFESKDGEVFETEAECQKHEAQVNANTRICELASRGKISEAKKAFDKAVEEAHPGLLAKVGPYWIGRCLDDMDSPLYEAWGCLN